MTISRTSSRASGLTFGAEVLRALGSPAAAAAPAPFPEDPAAWPREVAGGGGSVKIELKIKSKIKSEIQFESKIQKKKL